MACANSASPIFPVTRSMIGMVCQAPKKTPALPLGGRARQNRHSAGRSRSSSEGSKNASQTRSGDMAARSLARVAPPRLRACSQTSAPLARLQSCTLPPSAKAATCPSVG